MRHSGFREMPGCAQFVGFEFAYSISQIVRIPSAGFGPVFKLCEVHQEFPRSLSLRPSRFWTIPTATGARLSQPQQGTTLVQRSKFRGVSWMRIPRLRGGWDSRAPWWRFQEATTAATGKKNALKMGNLEFVLNACRR